MEPQELRDWMQANGYITYNVAALAQALGVDRRTVQRYLAGTVPIPETVALALEALAKR